MKFSRVIECSKKTFTAYFLSPAGADVGKISISCDGKVVSSARPERMSLYTWLVELVKVVNLARKIFAYQFSEDDLNQNVS